MESTVFRAILCQTSSVISWAQLRGIPLWREVLRSVIIPLDTSDYEAGISLSVCGKKPHSGAQTVRRGEGRAGEASACRGDSPAGLHCEPPALRWRAAHTRPHRPGFKFFGFHSETSIEEESVPATAMSA